MQEKQYKPRRGAVAGIGVISATASIAVGLVIGSAIPANAGPSAVASSTPVTVVDDGQTFVTVAGVDSSWDAVTSSFPQALPTGVSWPKDAPAFFDATGGGARDLYQPGLFATIAARFWRCAWLDKELDGERSGDTAQRAAAKNSLDKYAQLPGANSIPFDDYLSAMQQGAADQGVSEEDYEFSVDCGIYGQEGYVR